MIKIGIVDDHQLFLEGINAILSKQNDFEIMFVATSVSIAMEHLKVEVPDLIITDISMPEINGLEFIKLLKKEYPKTKILAISMFDNIDSLHDVDGYLLKETSMNEVITAINIIVHEGKKYFEAQANKKNELVFNSVLVGKREKEIINLIADGLTTDEIATKLFISRSTVETHRRNIFTKLQVNNIAEMVKKAMVLGVVR